MSKKLMLLALAAVSAVMFALPAAASANSWHITKAEKFTATGGKATLTVDPIEAGESVNEVECTSNSASGEYENTTTGKNLTITFTGCNSGGFPCTTPGQSSGTIKTTDLTFHNIMLEQSPKRIPGVLITSNAGHFATFECIIVFIPVHIEVRGNGIVGEVEKECGTSSKEAGLNFESVATGTQKYTQTETTGEKFDLTSTASNDNKTRTASEDATGTIKFGSSQTINCTP